MEVGHAEAIGKGERVALFSLFETGVARTGISTDPLCFLLLFEYSCLQDPLYKLIGEIGINLTFNNLEVTSRIKIKAKLFKFIQKRLIFKRTKKHSKEEALG